MNLHAPGGLSRMNLLNLINLLNLLISRFLFLSIFTALFSMVAAVPFRSTAQAYYGGSLPISLYSNGSAVTYSQNPVNGLPIFLSLFENSLLGGSYGGLGPYNGDGLLGGHSGIPGLYGSGVFDGLYGNFGLYGGGLFNNLGTFGSSPPISPRQEILLLIANNYLQGLSSPPVITAQKLYALITDPDPANDPLIISVQKPEDYQKGHLPGAINIPYQLIALPENLIKLPRNRLLVTYCYTGHTGAVAATILNMLGYKAVTLKFGIMSWTMDPVVRSVPPFIEGVDSFNFPITYGPNP